MNLVVGGLLVQPNQLGIGIKPDEKSTARFG